MRSPANWDAARAHGLGSRWIGRLGPCSVGVCNFPKGLYGSRWPCISLLVGLDGPGEYDRGDASPEEGPDCRRKKLGGPRQPPLTSRCFRWIIGGRKATGGMALNMAST
jgi:hypothetical protein